jgi:hypothetical protein
VRLASSIHSHHLHPNRARPRTIRGRLAQGVLGATRNSGVIGPSLKSRNHQRGGLHSLSSLFYRPPQWRVCLLLSSRVNHKRGSKKGKEPIGLLACLGHYGGKDKKKENKLERHTGMGGREKRTKLVFVRAFAAAMAHRKYVWLLSVSPRPRTYTRRDGWADGQTDKMTAGIQAQATKVRKSMLHLAHIHIHREVHDTMRTARRSLAPAGSPHMIYRCLHTRSPHRRNPRTTRPWTKACCAMLNNGCQGRG